MVYCRSLRDIHMSNAHDVSEVHIASIFGVSVRYTLSLESMQRDLHHRQLSNTVPSLSSVDRLGTGLVERLSALGGPKCGRVHNIVFSTVSLGTDYPARTLSVSTRRVHPTPNTKSAAPVRTDVSKERIASIIRVKKISEIGNC
jgi:hypothetical protein